MLKLTLNPVGAGCRLELNGHDISQFVTGISITANVGSLTTANLNYTGAVMVEGAPGLMTLQQAEHFVTCDECRTTVRGEKDEDVTIFEVTPLGADNRAYTVHRHGVIPEKAYREPE